MDIIVEQMLAVKSGSQESLIRGLQKGIIEELREHAARWIERRLEEAVERWLGRKPYQRRKRRSGRRISVACQKCGSSYQRDFVRNGRRKRWLLTLYGQLLIWLPRVKCECGGSVPIPFTVLKRWQRVWGDIRLQVQDWAERRLSLREMQVDLSRSLSTPVGLRILNEFVQGDSRLRIGHRQLSTVPPVVALDGIWVTQLVAQDAQRLDKLGRQRTVKGKKRKAVLIALGIWPQTGHYRVLDWEIAAGEGREDWDQLLARLMDRQLWPTRGLRLFVHDGGTGLKAALTRRYWETPSQRCVFHKLRNVWQAIVVPEEYRTRERRKLKQELISQAAAVFQAPNLEQAQALLAGCKEEWYDTQPEAIDTLLRDQDDTLRFYSLLRTNPTWKPEALRTTNYLERVNRMLRRTFRAAGAYHSPEGLRAAVERVLRPLLIV